MVLELIERILKEANENMQDHTGEGFLVPKTRFGNIAR